MGRDFRRERDPVQPEGVNVVGAVRLDGGEEAAFLERLDEVLVELHGRLAAGEDDARIRPDSADKADRLEEDLVARHRAAAGELSVAVETAGRALAGFDRTLEEAALDLGARPATVLWRITLPGIGPALISGWLLAFTLSLDDLVIASFVSGPSATTLPMAVYSSVRIGVTPEINALATIFLAVVFVTVAFAGWLMARHERRRRNA